MMVVFTKITIDAKQIADINEKLRQTEEDWRKLPHKYAGRVVKAMRRQFVSQQKRAPRGDDARRIRAVKQSGRTSVIKMPKKLYYLDTMKPHYVSLKRGRAITRWAQKYFDGSYRKTGRSGVHRGPRGAVRGGYLYVTPDPFTRKAITKTDSWLYHEIRRILEKAAII